MDSIVVIKHFNTLFNDHDDIIKINLECKKLTHLNG